MFLKGGGGTVRKIGNLLQISFLNNLFYTNVTDLCFCNWKLTSGSFKMKSSGKQRFDGGKKMTVQYKRNLTGVNL